ncbi:hypothetical protein RCZAHN_119 [Rhodobacter phage RcZahn]|nr:hypothetical protein RCZAHN_119 [Rhodobacter phage RcZahn]
MARHVFEARRVRVDAVPFNDMDSKVFGTVSKATTYLRETFGCSFPQGSVGQLKEGKVSSLDLKGKEDGEKIGLRLIRHEVL